MSSDLNPGDYWLGRVVRLSSANKLGHIRSFGPRNGVGELTILVLWECGGQWAVHPENLELL